MCTPEFKTGAILVEILLNNNHDKKHRTAKDEKDGKTAKLPASKANEVNKKLQQEKSPPAPTKTIQMVEKARDTKNNK